MYKRDNLLHVKVSVRFKSIRTEPNLNVYSFPIQFRLILNFERIEILKPMVLQFSSGQPINSKNHASIGKKIKRSNSYSATRPQLKNNNLPKSQNKPKQPASPRLFLSQIWPLATSTTARQPAQPPFVAAGCQLFTVI